MYTLNVYFAQAYYDPILDSKKAKITYTLNAHFTQAYCDSTSNK